MAPTLGMTGMDPATETALKVAFEQARTRLHRRWQLLPESEADHVVVDMDSMYGPMSWLRLHAVGKQVIGLTSAQRTQTDFHLSRPFDADTVAELLQAISATLPEGIEPPLPTPEPVLAVAPPAVAPPAQVPPAAEAAPAPPPPPRIRLLSDWLVPGALATRSRFSRVGCPDLFIDPVAREYHGPAMLKPLADCFKAEVEEQDFQPVDDSAWSSGVATLGPAQPLARLQWFGGLVTGGGSMLPGFDPAGRYQLSKWPQTEREYPKHFRIATAMMKGPATLDEVAAGSGVPLSDVVDFVNASLATGYAELVPEPPVEPTESTRSSGLFGRRKK